MHLILLLFHLKYQHNIDLCYCLKLIYRVALVLGMNRLAEQNHFEQFKSDSGILNIRYSKVTIIAVIIFYFKYNMPEMLQIIPSYFTTCDNQLHQD
jgi:hypothetical protein